MQIPDPKHNEKIQPHFILSSIKLHYQNSDGSSMEYQSTISRDGSESVCSFAFPEQWNYLFSGKKEKGILKARVT